MANEILPELWVPTPKQTTSTARKPENMVPSSVLVAKAIQNTPCTRMLRVLFDSGGTNTIIHQRALPQGVTPALDERPLRTVTAAGELQLNRYVHLQGIQLPEFTRSRMIDDHKAMVFSSPSQYDVILGSDFLTKVGIDTLFSQGATKWLDQTIPMRSPGYWQDPANRYLELYLADIEAEQHSVEIKEAKYEAVTPQEVVAQQHHLTASQRRDLQRTLETRTQLFDAVLRVYPKVQVRLELSQEAVPRHAKPYSVPRAHEEVFRKELEHLLAIGVLRRCGATEWASPTFIIPKKDGRVRWVSDFRYLNSFLKRQIFPLPRIQDVLVRRNGYKYFTKLDISMQYYTFELDEASRELCTIVTPFGKFQYCRLPMGIKQSPDIAQSIMDDIFHDMEDVEVYLDDIGIFSNNWNDHVHVVGEVLRRLEANGFSVNPLKCEWAVQETDWLGYWLTPTGLKPWKKKIDAILRMQPPKNQTQVKSFLGAVTYYRDMWPRRSHVLRPLTDLTGKGAFKWTERHQKAFDEMRAIMASEALMAYPDHNQPFHIFPDASDYQLGAAIIQNGKPVAYYSRKLTSSQRNYTTMEKELLSIVMTFREFRSMLLGAELHVHTDHRNLTYANLNSSRVLRWRLFLEEYSPTFHYIPGPDNVLGDCFSRLPRMDDDDEGENVSSLISPIAADPIYEDKRKLYDDFDEALYHLYTMHPANDHVAYPLHYTELRVHQQQDQELLQSRLRNPQLFRDILVSPGVALIHTRKHPEEEWKIALPTSKLEPVVSWYHGFLGHPGLHKLHDTISTHFAHPNLRRFIENYRCNSCQRRKQLGAVYGHPPAREAPLLPWSEVAVDLIGPWNVTVQGQELEFNALTCIDIVTNLVALTRIQNRTSAHIQHKFMTSWLAYYPRPNRCIHDNGLEFTSQPFQEMLVAQGIHDVPTTVKNPQSNAICERMHQTVANMLRVYVHAHPPANPQDAELLVDQALSSAMRAMACAVSRATNNSPAALAFNRDMLLDIPLLADLQAAQQHRQAIIDRNLQRSNAKRRSYDYQPGQRVLVREHRLGKLRDQAIGPPEGYLVTQVHVNGTITIQRRPHVTERINIR